jgi:carbonic anhydrase
MKTTRTRNLVALLAIIAVAAGGLGIGLLAKEAPSVTADEALKRLIDGNQRFAEEKPQHPHQSVARRAETAQTQQPIAVIVSCSDSRVGPEVVFDQGVGDVFVVRSAGHVVGDIELASIEYAVEHLGAPLIVVLGHQRCGAVAAAVEGGEPHGHLAALIDAIKPSVEETKDQPGDHSENAMRANVRRTVEQLKNDTPVLSERIKDGKLTIIGARYDLDSGKVEMLK